MHADTKYEVSQKLKNVAIGAIVLGIVCFLYALFKNPERSWVNYLIGNFYFLSMALSGGFIISICYVAGAGWVAPFRRIPEAMTTYLPYAFVLTLIMYFGVHTLYEWSHLEVVQNDEILSAKAPYLNEKFFLIRIVIFFVLWLLTTKALRFYAKKQDITGDLKLNSTLIKFAAIFLIVFGFSYSLASYDYIMSLEPHWFSTIFGVYTFSGLFVGGLAFITMTLLYLKNKGHMSFITENHLHDLGKLLFGFSTFWAYIWFSQYLLIWYSNIPEETTYYVLREKYNWDWLFYLNFAINWIIPFFALMTRNAKRSPFVLFRVCILLLIGRWLDLYLMTAPMVYKHSGYANPSIGIIEIGVAVGFAGLFVLVVAKSLSKNFSVSKKDPYLEEAIHLHQ